MSENILSKQNISPQFSKWWILLIAMAGAVMYGVSAGLRGDIGILLMPIVNHSGQSYGTVSFVIAIMQLAFGATQPFFGWLALQRSNRFVLTLGIVCFMSGLALIPLATSLPMLILAMGVLLGAGTGAVSFGIIFSALMQVTNRQGAMMISGILNASAGMGSTFFAPVIENFLVSGGLEYTVYMLCIPFIMVLGVVFWVTRGQHSNQTETVSKEDNVNTDFSHMFREAFKNRNYWLLIGGFSTCGFHMVIIEAHLFSQYVSYGITREMAAWAFAVYGIATIAGALLSGLLSNYCDRGKLLGFYYGFRGIWVLLYLFVMPKTFVTAVLFSFGLGMTGDATVSPTSGLMQQIFHWKWIATLLGFLFLCHQIGAFLSAWIGGIFVDTTGTYMVVWCLDVVVCLFASAVSFMIRDESLKTA